jgi:PAS domain-containing protein
MQQDLAKTILDHIGDGIISVDDACRVVFANDAACYIVGVEECNHLIKSQ